MEKESGRWRRMGNAGAQVNRWCEYAASRFSVTGQVGWLVSRDKTKVVLQRLPGQPASQSTGREREATALLHSLHTALRSRYSNPRARGPAIAVLVSDMPIDS